MAARIAEYKPAALRPSTRSGQRRNASQAAGSPGRGAEEGQEKLAALQKGEDKLAWGAAEPSSPVSILAWGAAPGLVAPILKVDTGKLPAHTASNCRGGLRALQGGQGQKPARSSDDAAARPCSASSARWPCRKRCRLSALRGRYQVKINTAALEAKAKK